MKTLYIECNMGAAGDMLTAALLELLPKEEQDAFVNELNNLGIPEVEYTREQCIKCGITGTHMKVTVHGAEEDEVVRGHHHEACENHKTDEYHNDKYDLHHTHSHEDHEHHHDEEHTHEHEDHEHHHDEEHSHDHEPHGHHHDEEHAHEHHHHHHSSMHDIEHIVRRHLHIPEKVKDDIMSVYALIAEAESHAHNRPVEEIHFHEVGSMDAVADITAVCLLMNKLNAKQVVVSPIHVGSGQVRCAHGILPVPAPATAYILKDVPIYGGTVKGELCTPTGAALLKHFATRFGDMPVMKTEAVGYGMGKKDFEAANCVRAFIGETAAKEDTITELDCNLDDITGEAVGYAMDKLLKAGALEVYTTAVGMKKNRLGIKLTVLCRKEDRDKIVRTIFKHTTTLGIREVEKSRYVLDRTIEKVSTQYGEVRKKVSTGYDVRREKYEYDDIVAIAEEKGISIEEILKNIRMYV